MQNKSKLSLKVVRKNAAQTSKVLLDKVEENTIRNFKFRIVAGHSCRVPPQSLIIIDKDIAASVYTNAYTAVYTNIVTIAAHYFFFSLGLKIYLTEL